MDKMTDSRAVGVLDRLALGADEPDVHAALAHAIARLREPAGVGGVEERQAWYAQQIETAQQAWAIQFGERYEHGDDVPDPDHFVALWLADRAAPKPPAEAQPTPIADLLADYEANGCDHTDMAWVRAAARRYVETMPDSQARCLLHVLAQEPAEAQAQGGGEVVAWVSRHDAMFSDAGNWRYTNPVLCSSQESPDLIPLYTAPPSAPVGVDGFDAWWLRTNGTPLTGSVAENAARSAWQAALAQQPAAEAERKFFSQDFYEEAREGKKPWPDQQPAAVPALEVFRIAGGDTECDPNPTPERALEVLRDLRACYDDALATQPGGSDND